MTVADGTKAAAEYSETCAESSVEPQIDTTKPPRLAPGAYAKLVGLRAKVAMNGQVARLC